MFEINVLNFFDGLNTCLHTRTSYMNKYFNFKFLVWDKEKDV